MDGFYDLTPIEFKYALKVVGERDIDIYKTRYEVARYIVRHIWNSAGKSLKSGREYKEPKDVGLFSWEAEERINKKTPVADLKEALLGWAKSTNKNKDKTKK